MKDDGTPPPIGTRFHAYERVWEVAGVDKLPCCGVRLVLIRLAGANQVSWQGIHCPKGCDGTWSIGRSLP